MSKKILVINPGGDAEAKLVYEAVAHSVAKRIAKEVTKRYWAE